MYMPRLSARAQMNHLKKSRIDSTDKTGLSRLFLFFLFYAVVLQTYKSVALVSYSNGPSGGPPSSLSPAGQPRSHPTAKDP